MLAVLWLSAALAAIAFSLATTVRGETERTSTAVDDLRSYYLATGAIERLLLYIQFRGYFMGPGGDPRYVHGMPLVPLSYPSGHAVVEIVPENSRLNLNLAQVPDLIRLLSFLGVDPGRASGIAAAIDDWRRYLPPTQPGLFDGYYSSLTPSFRARHASFEETEELLLIRGMTPDLYYGTYERDPMGGARLVRRGGLRDCVSIHGALGGFDINTTHPAVMLTIGLSPELVSAIVQRRSVTPFRTQQEVTAFGQGAGPAFQKMRLGGNSIYTLRASARLKLANGRLSDLRRTVVAQVKFGPKNADAPYHILRWYDGGWD